VRVKGTVSQGVVKAMSTIDKTAIEPPETRIVMHDVAWATYVELADQRRGSVPRMTYDEGTLELMSPKRIHENIGCLIGRMIEAYSEEKAIEVISLASTTVRRADLKKGYEADESYYVTHASRMLAKEELEFEVDPVPDLVIEVEITKPAIHKLQLLARMGVPEVWRHDGQRLEMLRLVDGQYLSIPSSIELPGLQRELIEALLALRARVGETALIKDFRQRVKQS